MRRIVNDASIDLGPAKKRRRASESHIYAIGDAEARFIKFGLAANPKARLAGIQTGSPLDLRLLATLCVGSRRNAFNFEYALHRAAGRFHIRGEWFFSCPRTLMIVEWMKFDLAKFAHMIADAAFSEVKHAKDDANGGVGVRRRQMNQIY